LDEDEGKNCSYGKVFLQGTPLMTALSLILIPSLFIPFSLPCKLTLKLPIQKILQNSARFYSSPFQPKTFAGILQKKPAEIQFFPLQKYFFRFLHQQSSSGEKIKVFLCRTFWADFVNFCRNI
jgi:hypothetical protein